MKTNSLALDASLSSQLGECKPGDSKSFMVTVTVDSKSDSGLNATVTGVDSYGEEEEEVEETNKRAPALQRALDEA